MFVKLKESFQHFRTSLIASMLQLECDILTEKYLSFIFVIFVMPIFSHQNDSSRIREIVPFQRDSVPSCELSHDGSQLHDASRLALVEKNQLTPGIYGKWTVTFFFESLRLGYFITLNSLFKYLLLFFITLYTELFIVLMIIYSHENL